jgi:glycosyltransferase involved in cell wall biosynthesis
LTIHRIPSLRRKQDRSGALEQFLFILSASFWTFAAIPHLKPNATLAFFGVPSGVVAWVLKLLFGIPYIVSLRGGDVPGFRPYDFDFYHRLVAPFLHVIWRQASAVVANSNGLGNLAQTFDSRIDIPIIPNGVDLDVYFTKEHSWSTPRILSVGRLVYQKGLDLAVHALSGLQDLNWEWNIIGDGPEMNALQSLVESMGIRDRITFLGWQSREELIQCYKQSNLFLFPSRHEGMPNAVLEAMASGLPVIASRIAGNEELVLDGETGILVKTEHIEELRSALRNLIIDPPLRQKMGAASRQRVEQFYSWENTATAYALLLEKAS